MATAHSKPNVLIAPLNWGLGHATRCMPVIDELLAQKLNVSLASDGPALQLLKKEYPNLPTFDLPAFDIKYPTFNMAFNMLSQANKIRRAIKQDHLAIKQIATEQNIQVVISDNRFGCYHKDTYNIFITHQLNIKAPIQLAEKFIARWNKTMIKPFDCCWVPDYETEPRLSGELSIPSPISNISYIGPLSRFKVAKQVPIIRDVLVILSGPEPQRSHLEKEVLRQAQNLDYGFLIVKGKMNDNERGRLSDHIEIAGYLTSKEMNEAINSSKYIVSRSGYSTIMDLAALGKTAILIPTPGQTEQEYLGQYFHQKGIFYSQNQKDLNLKDAIREVSQFSGFNSTSKRVDDLKVAVELLLKQFI